MSKTTKNTQDAKRLVDRVVIFVMSEIKFAATILIGLLPMLLFLDFGLGIQLVRDYGWAGATGFILCLVFYSEFTMKGRS